MNVTAPLSSSPSPRLLSSSSNLQFLAFLSVLGVLLVAVVLYLKLPYCRVIRQRDKRWLPGNVPRFGVRTVAQEREEDRRRQHEPFPLEDVYVPREIIEEDNAFPFPIAYNPEVVPVGVYTDAVVVSTGGLRSGDDDDYAGAAAANNEMTCVTGTIMANSGVS